MRDDVKYQQGQIVICHLCDKQLLKTDDTATSLVYDASSKIIKPGKRFFVVGKQSGDMIHMSCYRTWLIEKMRGKDV